MAMLAGPRRKQKVINLRAKNNAWSNDTNKFGQRMLEKMGWSSGKGLGSKENGIIEHVVARYKNDDRGLGFEDKNDQWTKHEDDFNALLSNLSNASGDNEKLHSGVSLEVKSKKSKARVHYHKFTRGKDLTRYSEKDLANIFGKKSLKNKDKDQVEEQTTKDGEETEQKFTEKGSMEDYFKNKLAAFKTKPKILDNDNKTQQDEADYAFKGFSAQPDENKSNYDEQETGFSFYNKSKCTEDNSYSIIEKQLSVDETERKEKKKKKSKNKATVLEENAQSYQQQQDKLHSETDNLNIEVIKKKKKTKRKQDSEEPLVEPLVEEVVEVKVKKSKSKCSLIPTSSQNQGQDDYVPKKKKKRKNKETEL